MNKPFKIYSLMVVKNEADIIRESLLDASRWSDKVIVLDNGSTDGTREIVEALAKGNERIVFFGEENGTFRIGMRARLFRAYRKEMHRGDWWCVRLDADEFYPGDVRAFLAGIDRRYRTVAKSSTDYLLSKEDLPLLTGDFKKDRMIFHLTEQEHRRERRFMRHEPWLVWLERWRYPHPWGKVAPEGIPVEHYQYRSVEQMQKRWETRHRAIEAGCASFLHERCSRGWEEYLRENRPQEMTVLFREATHVLKTGRNEIREKDGIVVKRFGHLKGLKRIIYSWLRKTKARRSYDYAIRLNAINREQHITEGDLTPAPVGFKEIRKKGMVSDTYYACRLSALPYTFKDLRRKDFPERERCLQEVGRFAARLHKEGILHADFSQGNILLDGKGHFQLVDLNRIRWRQPSVRKGLRNLERLRLHDDEAFQIICEAYKEERLSLTK